MCVCVCVCVFCGIHPTNKEKNENIEGKKMGRNVDGLLNPTPHNHSHDEYNGRKSMRWTYPVLLLKWDGDLVEIWC